MNVCFCNLLVSQCQRLCHNCLAVNEQHKFFLTFDAINGQSATVDKLLASLEKLIQPYNWACRCYQSLASLLYGRGCIMPWHTAW